VNPHPHKDAPHAEGSRADTPLLTSQKVRNDFPPAPRWLDDVDLALAFTGESWFGVGREMELELKLGSELKPDGKGGVAQQC